MMVLDIDPTFEGDLEKPSYLNFHEFSEYLGYWELPLLERLVL
jgi:hypothetical protein